MPRGQRDHAIDAVNVNARRAMAAYQRSARSGQSTSSPWGACASLDQAACDAMLQTKRAKLASTLVAENLVAASIADAADVFGAQAAGHRHRAQFARSGDELPVRLCQFDAKLREQVAVDASLPVLSRPIAAALRVIERLSAEASPLWQRLGGVEAHSTSCGGICVTLAYRPVADRQPNAALPPPPDPDGWMEAARELLGALLRDADVLQAIVVGRWRGHRLVCGEAPAIRESFALSDGRTLLWDQPEGQFSNPCAEAARHTIDWLCAAARDVLARRADIDLLELHSGFGASTVALASCFRRVLSVEISRELAEAQRHNLELNGITNVTVARGDADDAGWLRKEEAEGGWRFGVALIDPPRGGLSEATLGLLAEMEVVLGVWCNSEAMVANLQALTKTHVVKKLAMIDQFPFTDFLECAVLLERKEEGVVLRGVPTSLGESEVAAQLGVPAAAVTRFMRTAGGSAVPLPLVRVRCDAASCDALLAAGTRLIGGVECAVERPIHDEGSAAARGRRRVGEAECATVLRGVRRLRVPEDLGAAAVGDAVYCVSGGHFHRGWFGTVVAEEDEHTVVVEGATRRSVARRNVRRVLSADHSGAPLVLCCAETDEYRRLARVEASARDGAVLEIGSDLGLTTAVLAERVGAKNCVGVDLAMESVEKARASYPDLSFEQLDVFEEGAVAALQKLAPAGFGRVFIDINGSRMLPAVLEALRLAVEELGAPVVVVKSRALHAHLGENPS